MWAYVGRHTRRVVFAATALFAAIGGIAYATIPDSNGVYTACRLNGVGTIRLIDPSLPPTNFQGHCTSLETQITWNQQGQPGPQGAQGPQGPAGPSPAFFGSGYSGDVTTGPDVFAISPPAGSYLIESTVSSSLAAGKSSGGQLDCTLELNGTAYGVGGALDFGHVTTLTALMPVVSAGDTIATTCNSPSGTPTAANATMTLLQVKVLP